MRRATWAAEAICYNAVAKNRSIVSREASEENLDAES
jgi:hypothetical protein